ncbi:competence/damage-inducible protein cinA [Geothermobacter ehrlichii]|uniref:CinA-like protein n=1 Tax=Geothermobacter ehrlichii TaxID=213224 RepID=A0A5D3WHF4_9BACT|nr:CinA family nicotinamide mononucleotide deamidase-related protein [Geothermobacter ehrlichii]TYO97499.1 competence/damage-inducible protein cinA [Geothermobacter ehrlichii]
MSPFMNRESFDIAVLTTGSELLSGELVDGNTRKIAGRLAENGLKLRASLTVGDRLEDIVDALRQLAGRFRAVIVTGGLGPTDDDLTTLAAARAFSRPLDENPQALNLIVEHFRRLNRVMPAANRKQALLPQGAEVLVNGLGTAPGFCLEHRGCLFFFLPGVPREMQRMLETEVLPRLLASSGAPPALREERLRVFGLPEPEVESRLRRHGVPELVELGFGVEFPVTIVKLRSRDAAALAAAAERTRAALAGAILFPDQTTLAELAAKKLRQAKKTLALAESCTGGLIAARLTDIPGASAFFERGAVSYANSAKQDWLGVPAAILDEQGAVSAECAAAMAEGIRRAAGTDLGLAVTGIAGPDGGTKDKPVGTVFLALAHAAGTETERLQLGGDRWRIRELTAMTALARLIRHLEDEQE